MNLPKKFADRMRGLLGEEYENFADCYIQEKRQGLRINTLKISVEDFLRITPFTLTPIPWTENGFFYREEDAVTRHPHYYCGLYYIQEPSAMVPASRLPIEMGDMVLDLCAAPGGKATELGARLRGTGMLVANDISASRAKGLLKNIEQFGIMNAYVTGEAPDRLLQQFGCCFDKILVDAPCSGEGMFRKDPALMKSWLERGPEYYAPIQREILSCAVRMLKPGGMLLYSTCTFSPEEDEEIVAYLLEKFPQMEMVKPEGYTGFSGGAAENISDAISQERELQWKEVRENCIRIWPHRMEGEGHFAALMRKKEEPSEAAGKIRKEKDTTDHEKLETLYQKYPETGEFFRNLKFPLLHTGSILQNGELLLWQPAKTAMPKLRYLRTGLLLGSVKKNRFEPSQALAMALRKENFSNVLDLPSVHPAVIRYLKGETLDIPEAEGCRSGWVLVCCDGYPLGWGKCVNGVVRNKYYPGWRML